MEVPIQKSISYCSTVIKLPYNFWIMWSRSLCSLPSQGVLHGPCTFSPIPSMCFHLAKLTLQCKGLCTKLCSPSKVIRVDSPCPGHLTALGSGVLWSLKGEEMSMSLRGLGHSLIIFPQLCWRVGQGGWVNGAAPCWGQMKKTVCMCGSQLLLDSSYY